MADEINKCVNQEVILKKLDSSLKTLPNQKLTIPQRKNLSLSGDQRNNVEINSSDQKLTTLQQKNLSLSAFADYNGPVKMTALLTILFQIIDKFALHATELEQKNYKKKT